MIEMDRLGQVYREALRLHKISWQKRIEGKSKWFWQKDTFDDSHIHFKYKSSVFWNEINEKLESFVKSKNYENGKIKAKLNIDEAITLLIKQNYDNINYQKSFDIDLENYKLGGNTYKIEIE